MSWQEKAILVTAALTVMLVMALLPTDPKSRVRASLPSAVDWAQVVDDPEDVHTLVWQGIISHVSGKEDSWIESNLERLFSLELKPLFMDSNAFQRRRPLMLAGGDIPDLMWNGDPLGVRTNLRNGFIMEVPYEVMLQYAPTYVEYLNRYGREAWLYAHHQGKNYGIPTFFADATRPRIGCWRMDWLDNVGIKQVPETVDEMGEALRRFRFDDPDGNGKLDTYGWSPYIGHWSIAFAEIFAAFDVLGFDFMLTDDGEVVWGGVLPGARQALEVLQAWYEEGLLDPDFLLETRESGGKFTNGKVGYNYAVDAFSDYDLSKTTSLAGKVAAFSPGARIVPGPPLRNQAGQRRGRSWGGAGHILQFGIQLEQQPEKVVRVLKMLEACAASEQLYLEAQRGQRGRHWDYAPEQGVHLLPPFEENRALQQQELLPRTVFFFPSTIEPVYDHKYFAVEELEWLAKNKNPDWSMVNALGKSDVVPSAGRYLEDLRNWQMTVFVEMVVGSRSIESFDKFVAEWRRRGGDVVTREANEMYREMRKIFDKVGANSSENIDNGL